MITLLTKKSILVIIVSLFVTVQVLSPISLAYAEEISPTPTETEAVVTEEVIPTPVLEETHLEATNEADVTNNIDSTSNTGDNVVSDTAGEPSITPTITATDSSELLVEAELVPPQQIEDTTPPQSSSGGSSTVTTGDAVSVTEIENIVNTTSVDSTFVHHTINLFVNENGDIDLSDPFKIAQSIIVEEENLSPTVNVLATDSENYAYLSNNAVSEANTGENNIEGAKEAVVNTGDAYSVMTLLNKVNFTIVGSTVHIVTINIFGNLTGNIILPEFESLGTCTTCGMSVVTENEAEVINNVSSSANTGENNLTYEKSGELTTGHAESTVGLTNIVNTNIFGMLLWNLSINVFGEWNGDFLGWGTLLSALTGGSGMNLSYASAGSSSGCSSCTGDVSVYNSAYVENNIESSANTGNNTVSARNGSLTTGNAYSAVTLTNFVNSNFVNSTGFFGFINIFGTWNGNIGGSSKFIEETPTGGVSESNSQNTSTLREDGGKLSVININNVGEYVNPGDTVTFFLDISNPGTGKVYDAKVHLVLFNESGENVGGSTLKLNDIQAGKKVKVSTGLVLSDTTPGGKYTAVARAEGVTGVLNNLVVSEAYSEFIVSGSVFTYEESEEVLSGITNSDKKTPSVLGTTNNEAVGKDEDYLFLLLIGLLTTAFGIRVIKKREQFSLLFVSNSTFKEKLYTLRMFLL